MTRAKLERVRSDPVCRCCCPAAALVLVLVLVAGCGGPEPSDSEEGSIAMKLTSTAFAAGEAIPARHTCDGEDLSPRLEWTGAPAGVKGFALVADDPDAPGGTWVHWVAWGIPAGATGLAEGVAGAETTPQGASQGRNDFGRLGYGGPCPPPGKPHRYFFKLYALDATLDLAPGATKKDLLAAMKGHVLAQGELMGTYRRR